MVRSFILFLILSCALAQSPVLAKLSDPDSTSNTAKLAILPESKSDKKPNKTTTLPQWLSAKVPYPLQAWFAIHRNGICTTVINWESKQGVVRFYTGEPNPENWVFHVEFVFDANNSIEVISPSIPHAWRIWHRACGFPHLPKEPARPRDTESNN